jgi:hypothetical protein
MKGYCLLELFFYLYKVPLVLIKLDFCYSYLFCLALSGIFKFI